MGYQRHKTLNANHTLFIGHWYHLQEWIKANTCLTSITTALIQEKPRLALLENLPPTPTLINSILSYEPAIQEDDVYPFVSHPIPKL